MLRAVTASVLLAAASPAPAAVEEQREILATVQLFFAALAARDEARVRTLVMPEGKVTAHGIDKGNVKVRSESWAAWAKRLPAMKQKPEERMHNPSVRVSGSLAMVWTDYSFHRDGKFSHCGVDLFDLAKVDGRWRIVNLSFTMKTQGCIRR